MTGQDLLDIVLLEGVDITETQKELVDEFDKAIEEDRVYFIPKGDDTIGFLTWEYHEEEGRVLINKCVVYRKFRNKANFFQLRKYFRSLFKGVEFYWKSKKRNRACYVR
jgi:hypothetical protein